MTSLGVDYSFARPSIAQVKALGASWVGRYLSPDPAKNLTKKEADELLANQLAIVLFWESTATRAQQGYTAGHLDGHAAAAQRAACGLPDTVPIYFAVDADVSWSSVAPYLAGAEQAVGVNRAGVYGGFQVIQGAANHGYRYLCQTEAWSHGQWSPAARIRQQGQLLHGQVDEDLGMVADFGQYPNPITGDDLTMLFQNTTDFQQSVQAALLAVLQGGQGQAALAQAVASQPARDGIAFADLWWWDHVLSGTVPAGASKAQAALIADIHARLQKLNATSAPTRQAAFTTEDTMAPDLAAAEQLVNAEGAPPLLPAADSADPASQDVQAV